MTWLRSALQAENENDDSERLFLASRDDATIQPVSAQNNSKSWMLVLALIGSFVIGILTATLATLPRSANLRPGELEIPTFADVQRQFTGGLKYDDHGRLYLSSGSEMYVGNSSTVQDAWRLFDAVQIVELEPAAVSVQGLYTDKRSKIITIPDVFHQLHCLKQIRLALADVDYRTSNDAKRHIHVDHCVDYLRQVIQCRGDMTPLKLYYSDSAQRLMIDFDGLHTCKDFDAIFQWAKEHHVTQIQML